ncbi:predicted protein [Naegleria gruberi]|uniref:Predicted protein n=1 Tax=Naegleria gruberi TaxID=5762 RepID=D2V240_NAEGR|nr:uncharacterized protein NAEGRDRAFT_46075 [Naegleria gruberi]EFC48838.1 predicted protein [Naegleria gruberi]|eukprot:XP_002681582.1 predicted protein [Naegleria gruberi strain NEG-M]
MSPNQMIIQPFNQCIYMIHHATTDIEEFYMIDASDADNIVKRLIATVNLNDLANVSTENAPICRLEQVILDWESDLMNQLVGSQKLIRGFAKTVKRSENYCSSYRSCFVWNSVNDFDVKNIVIADINEDGISFVDGFMLMSYNRAPSLEKSQSVNSLKLEPCNEITMPQSDIMSRTESVAIVIPCSNVIKRDYSLNGFFDGKDKVYLFDLKSGKFDLSVTGVSFGATFVNSSCGVCNVPFLEGERLRVFLLLSFRLYEIVWKGEENNSDLILIRHLEWIERINSVTRMDNFGLLIQSRSKDGTQYYVYCPQPYNTENLKKEGKLIELPKSVYENVTDIVYAPKSKRLLSVKDVNLSKSLSLEEIQVLPSNIIKSIFNEEEYLEKLKFDTSFKTYQPRLITDACEVVTTIPNHPRISRAYQILEGRHNEIEIVAGIGCKNYIDKLGDLISNDYVELNIEDLADYLGAPVIYEQYSIVEYTYFIKDMVDGLRSSKAIEFSRVTRGGGGGYGSSYAYFNDDFSSPKFIGILSCRPKQPEEEEDDEMEDEEEKTEKEYEQLFRTKEFKVESTSMVVIDPFTTNSGVIIKNVRPGIWNWKTTHKSKDHVDGGYEDHFLTAQIVAIHQDYYEELSSDPKLWLVPNNVYRKLERNHKVERDEYYDDEIEGGWFVMKLGVGVDVAMAGIFDEKYFNDEKCLELKRKPKSKFEASCKLSFNSDWQDYFFKKMEQDNYPSKLAAPFGIITSSGYGDGCYACLFKKSKGGDVIAVRLVFC